MSITVCYTSQYDRPRHASPGAAAYDLNAVEDKIIKPGEIEKISTGISVEIPSYYCGLILARSSLHQLGNGCCLANGVGLIDPDYRGEIKLALYNPIGPQTLRIAAGHRIAQIIFVPFTSVEWLRVSALSETDRGLGGFGSTGV